MFSTDRIFFIVSLMYNNTEEDFEEDFIYWG